MRRPFVFPATDRCSARRKCRVRRLPDEGFPAAQSTFRRMKETNSVVVVGGGLIGLATARALLKRDPSRSVMVLEKESAAGQHQSTHNSGVLHAGLYYKPGSLKAELCSRGRGLMEEYCREHAIPYARSGKLVVAVAERELAGLQ